MLKRINRLASFIAALAVSALSLPAVATNIDNVVFFGDSLSDTGNIWFATAGLPPPPYFQGSEGAPPEFTGGQWSSPEGPSWPTLFASEFDLTATPSLVPVPYANNFAWGGARTGANPAPGALWLEQQVALYLAPFQSSGTSPPPDTLASIMIGGNDVAGIVITGDQAALEAGITSIISQLTVLYGQGVRRFVVSNVPDVGATPRFQAAGPQAAFFATTVSIQWNAALAAALETLELPGAVIDLFDLFAFSKDPELLALFANTTDACLTEFSICSDPASYFYWDSFHPSSTGHRLLADALYLTVFDARHATRDITERLQAIVENNPGECADKAEDALGGAATALEEFGKMPPDNEAALGNLEGAVGDLEAVLKDGFCPDPDEITDLLVDISRVARTVAVLAIDESRNRKDRRHAEKSLAKGDALRAKGKYKDAVSNYKDALSKVS